MGFLWSANLSATSLVATTMGISHTPTNAPYEAAFSTAWNAVLTDPNFQFGRNASLGNAIAVGTVNTVSGLITYNGGSPFGVTGTSTGGGSVRIFFVAWSNLYADPSAAAAAGSLMGWSNPFQYQYGDTATAPIQMGTQAQNGGYDARFGVGVPEPSMSALAGLGAAAMLISRRRSSSKP